MVLMWRRDCSRKTFYQWSWKKWKALNCKHALFLKYHSFSLLRGERVALCQMPPACNWLCLVVTTAWMRHMTGVKHILGDKPLNFLISSLLFYSRTTKCTRSIKDIAFDPSFPLEFVIQYQIIWLICRNLQRCLLNIFPRLLVVNQDQKIVIALYYMFPSTSDEKNITKEIF